MEQPPFLFFGGPSLQKEKPAGMKLASYDRIKHDHRVIGRILSASRAVLKTHLKQYTTAPRRIPFHFYNNLLKNTGMLINKKGLDKQI
jgi:hypothetical protein